MQFYHESIGHPGAQRMADTIAIKYWWPRFRDDVQDYVNQCRFCLRRKPARGAAVPIQEYTGPNHPWERVHMDLTGPFPRTDAGNQYVLVAKCALTRYAEIIAIPNKESRTVAHALVQSVYLRHGSITTLISDRGTEFTNETMRGVATILKTKRICTTPANPRSNGVAENHMRTFKDSLASVLNANQTNWDTELAFINLGYNTTVNSATGFTPFFMMHGREACGPSEEWTRSKSKLTSVDKYLQKLVQSLQLIWTTVGDLKPKQVETMNADLHPRNHRPFEEYKKGTFCFLKRVPRRDYLDWKEKIRYKLSAK